jgi:O-antigen ligase
MAEHSNAAAIRGMRRLNEATGFHRTALSVMLAGASWAILSARVLFPSRLLSWGTLGVAGIVLVGQAMSTGRAGYLAWVCVGLVLCLLRWRIFLLLGPLAVAGILALVPAVKGRALEGILTGDRTSEEGEGALDEEKLSAGRLGVWPYMLEKVKESPLVGFGRRGYDRSGLAAFIHDEVDPTFPHPHSAYIEWLLDNGWLGLAVIVSFYLLVLHHSLVLFRDSSHPLYEAAGGMAFALVFALLIGALTGRSFYAEEGTVGMWCGIALMLRVWLERSAEGGQGGERGFPAAGRSRTN